MNSVNFKTTSEEMDLIEQIVDRIIPMAKRANVSTDRVDWLMDITACHVNGMALDLESLITSDDRTFAHDVFGIRHHIDRQSGKILDYFLPKTKKGTTND